MLKCFELVDDNSEMLYYLGRLTAVFIIGPILIYKALFYEDYILLTIGILLIIWDGIKVGLQLYKYCKHKELDDIQINDIKTKA